MQDSMVVSTFSVFGLQPLSKISIWYFDVTWCHLTSQQFSRRDLKPLVFLVSIYKRKITHFDICFLFSPLVTYQVCLAFFLSDLGNSHVLKMYTHDVLYVYTSSNIWWFDFSVMWSNQNQLIIFNNHEIFSKTHGFQLLHFEGKECGSQVSFLNLTTCQSFL